MEAAHGLEPVLLYTVVVKNDVPAPHAFPGRRNAEHVGPVLDHELRIAVHVETDHGMAGKRLPGDTARHAHVAAVADLHERVDMPRVNRAFDLARAVEPE